MLDAFPGTNTNCVGSLTSVFGMGTGGTNLLWPSQKFYDLGVYKIFDCKNLDF